MGNLSKWIVCNRKFKAKKYFYVIGNDSEFGITTECNLFYGESMGHLWAIKIVKLPAKIKLHLALGKSLSGQPCPMTHAQ
jgi:hypothetical protein